MFVETVSLFAGMNPDFLREVEASFDTERCDTGMLLYRHGQSADFLYFLSEGRVRVILGGQGQIALVVSRPGDAIGWSSLIDQEVHTTSAECLVPCLVKKIARQKLAELFEKDPRSGLQFYRRLAGLLRQQLLDTYSLIPAAHGEKRSTPGF